LLGNTTIGTADLNLETLITMDNERIKKSLKNTSNNIEANGQKIPNTSSSTDISTVLFSKIDAGETYKDVEADAIKNKGVEADATENTDKAGKTDAAANTNKDAEAEATENTAKAGKADEVTNTEKDVEADATENTDKAGKTDAAANTDKDVEADATENTDKAGKTDVASNTFQATETSLNKDVRQATSATGRKKSSLVLL
jgi:hypothetical protein